MTHNVARPLLGAALAVASLTACTPPGDAGECDSQRPCDTRGEICDTVQKVCIDAGLDVDATAPPPATGTFATTLPFFRGRVCLATQAKPGERIPVSLSPCLHPCVTAGAFQQKNTWRCTGSLCEGLNLLWIEASGAGCPSDVFAKFDPAMCTYELTIDAAQGPFSPGGIAQSGTMTTEVPFLTHEEIQRVADGASGDEIWEMVVAYPADESRVLSINLNASNPSAPANCTDDPSACECFEVGF